MRLYIMEVLMDEEFDMYHLVDETTELIERLQYENDTVKMSKVLKAVKEIVESK